MMTSDRCNQCWIDYDGDDRGDSPVDLEIDGDSEDFLCRSCIINKTRDMVIDSGDNIKWQLICYETDDPKEKAKLIPVEASHIQTYPSMLRSLQTKCTHVCLGMIVSTEFDEQQLATTHDNLKSVTKRSGDMVMVSPRLWMSDFARALRETFVSMLFSFDKEEADGDPVEWSTLSKSKIRYDLSDSLTAKEIEKDRRPYPQCADDVVKFEGFVKAWAAETCIGAYPEIYHLIRQYASEFEELAPTAHHVEEEEKAIRLAEAKLSARKAALVPFKSKLSAVDTHLRSKQQQNEQALIQLAWTRRVDKSLKRARTTDPSVDDDDDDPRPLEKRTKRSKNSASASSATSSSA